MTAQRAAQTGSDCFRYCYGTLVCPNWYWVWSMSREPSSFSTAFLLSTNESSGIALGFRMRYLMRKGLMWGQTTPGRTRTQISTRFSGWDWVLDRPLFKLGVQDTVRKALPANPDPLQDPIAPELVEDQERIHHACKRVRRSTGGVQGGDSLETSRTRMGDPYLDSWIRWG